MFNIFDSLLNLWKTTGIYQMLFLENGDLNVAFVKTLIMNGSSLKKPMAI